MARQQVEVESVDAGRRASGVRPMIRAVFTPEVQLNVAEWGVGRASPPLLLLHGLANRWQAMSPLVPDLIGDWHLIAPDLRGHGGSARTGRRYSITHFTEDVAALVTDWALPPVAVYGHSLGGLVALSLAAEHPALVRSVVVADSAVFAKHDRHQASFPAAIAPLLDVTGPPPKQVDAAVMEALRTGRLVEGYDGRRVLSRVRCPVLLLQAEAALGGHMDDLDVRRALTLLADGYHVKVRGVGHQLQLVDRRAVLSAIVPFLARAAGHGGEVGATRSLAAGE
jgi:pimeloyl-ACP methyl ester carboxylesterase